MNFVSRQNEVLFFKADIHGVMDAQLRNMNAEIQGIDADRLLNTPVDDVVSYFAEKFRIEVPVLHRSQALLDEPEETFIEMNDYGRQIRVPAALVTLTVPFDARRTCSSSGRRLTMPRRREPLSTATASCSD